MLLRDPWRLPSIGTCSAQSRGWKSSIRPQSGVSEALGCRLDIHAVQTQKVFAENFSLGLVSDLRIAALLNDVVRQLKLPEFFERPLRVPDGGFPAEDDLVFAGPPHEFAHDFGKNARLARDEIHGRGDGGIKVRETNNLPERFVQ